MTDEHPEPTRFKCPNCGRFIGTADGTYLEAVPCQCGWQTTVSRGPRIRRLTSRET